jgi:hypothetical protein
MAFEDDLASILDELAKRFQVRVDRKVPQNTIAQMIALRAIEFRRMAFILADPSPASAMVVLRALVDATILVQWIELCPKLHAALFGQEGERQWLQDSDALARLLALQGRPIPDTDRPGPRERARVARVTRRYRDLARRHGIPIDTKPDKPLLPNIRERAKAIGAVAELEMYQIGIGQVGAWTHTSARALSFDLQPGPDGVEAVPTAGVSPAAIRRFAISFEAAAGAAVSRMLGLGIEAQYDHVRSLAVSWSS